MSWSFAATGTPLAVLKRAKERLTAFKCVEPEEQIKAAFLEILQTSLSRCPPQSVVKVAGTGSQSTNQAGEASNYLNVLIEPQGDFVL